MSQQDALGQQPADRRDADGRVDRRLEQRGQRQRENQSDAGVCQPEGGPSGGGRQPQGQPGAGVSTSRQPSAAPVSAGPALPGRRQAIPK